LFQDEAGVGVSRVSDSPKLRIVFPFI